jgi:hypothetical protein
MADPFEKFNTTPPVVQETSTAGEQNNGISNQEVSNQGVSNQATTEQNTGVTQIPTGEPKPETGQETPKPDEFIETFNKRFNTQYKNDDEIKPIFELPKKVTEYEGKLKDRDDLAKSVEQYKKDLENLERTASTKYLSDPLMQKAYVASQLQKKYPDKDPFILQEIAMSDVAQMGDLDAVAKERKIRYPSMKLENIKAVILNDLGIDGTTPPEEWDSLAKDKLTMMAGDARENIKNLTKGIELPKVETPEETQKRYDEELSKRVEATKPYREQYSKFDKFNMGEGLDYTVDKEFQEKLGDMFDAFMVKAGNDPTPENLQTLEDLRDAFFFNSHKKEIFEAMYKDAETKIKTKLDEKLGNTQVPNTATASDGVTDENSNRPGVQQFKRDFSGTRATRI